MFRVLKPEGSWVLGDLIFKDEQAESKAMREYEWLEEEYFTRTGKLRTVFTELRLELNARQFTPVTWVVWTIKPKDVGR